MKQTYPYSQSGNVMTFLLGGITIMAMITFGAYQLMSGPMTSAGRISQDALVKNQMITVGRIAILDAVNQSATGDCDSDLYTEPRPFRDAGTAPHPTGGGLIPWEMGAPEVDSWGTGMGYCVWDVGPISGASGCNNGTGYLDGADNPQTGESQTLTVFALISAGPDKAFTTSCLDYVDSTTDLITTSGDDIIQRFTYMEAAEAAPGLWSLKPGDMDTAIINRGIEVGNNIALGAGAVQASTLNTAGKVIAGGGLTLGDQNDATVCNSGDAGTVRYNTSSNGIQVCNGSSWVSTGSSISFPILAPGNVADAPSYSFSNDPDTGMLLYETDSFVVTASSGKSMNVKAGDSSLMLSTSESSLASAGTLSFTSATPNLAALTAPDFMMSINGGLQISDTSTGCDSTTAGTLKYIAASDAFYFCSGSAWVLYDLSGEGGGGGGGGIAGSCDDYTSTVGLESVSSDLSISHSTYFPGSRIPIQMGYISSHIGDNYFSGKDYITACVTGTQGSPTLDYGNPYDLDLERADATNKLALLPRSYSPIVHINAPPAGSSYNGTVTYGTGVSQNYTVTSQSPGAYIFMTSTMYNGNLGGLAGADAKCQTRADASLYIPDGLTFKAVISNSTTNAKDRITVSYPVINILGDIVANSDIWGSGVLTSPGYDENGVYRSQWAWTGSNNDGTKRTLFCTDWTSNSSGVKGQYGFPQFTSQWLQGSASGSSCSGSSGGLICISQ